MTSCTCLAKSLECPSPVRLPALPSQPRPIFALSLRPHPPFLHSGFSSTRFSIPYTPPCLAHLLHTQIKTLCISMISSLLSRPCWRRALRHLPASTNAFVLTTTRHFSSTVSGPKQTFRTGVMAQQALASAVASAGSTVVLTTITAETGDTMPTSSSSLFLTNEFRERHHAVGQMPKQRHRRDNRMLSLQEVLASRAIDRALRPLLKKKWSMQQQGGGASLSNKNEQPYIHRWHVSSSLQALNHRDNDKQQDLERGGDPIPLAINTAAALLDLDVAAVSLAVMLKRLRVESMNSSIAV